MNFALNKRQKLDFKCVPRGVLEGIFKNIVNFSSKMDANISVQRNARVPSSDPEKKTELDRQM